MMDLEFEYGEEIGSRQLFVFFHDFPPFPYHHTIHSHSIVPLTSTFLYSWVGPQTTQPVFNPDPVNGVHLQGSLWRNKDGGKIPRDSQYQRFRLPAGLVGSQRKKFQPHHNTETEIVLDNI